VTIEIKDLFSSAIENIWEWTPPDPYDVYFDLSLNIGLKGEEAADIFQIVVSTPQGMQGKARPGSNIIDDRSTLIVERYDREEVRRHLEEVVAKCDSDSQIEWQWKLQRYFRWEYEDYVVE